MTRAREELVLSGTGDASVFLKELQTSRLHREMPLNTFIFPVPSK